MKTVLLVLATTVILAFVWHFRTHAPNSEPALISSKVGEVDLARPSVDGERQSLKDASGPGAPESLIHNVEDSNAASEPVALDAEKADLESPFDKEKSDTLLLADATANANSVALEYAYAITAVPDLSNLESVAAWLGVKPEQLPTDVIASYAGEMEQRAVAMASTFMNAMTVVIAQGPTLVAKSSALLEAEIRNFDIPVKSVRVHAQCPGRHAAYILNVQEHPALAEQCDSMRIFAGQMKENIRRAIRRDD